MSEPTSMITVCLPTIIKRKLEQMASEAGHKKLAGFIRKQLAKITEHVTLKTLEEPVSDAEFEKLYREVHHQNPNMKQVRPYQKSERLNQAPEPKEVKDKDYSKEIDPSVLSMIDTKWGNAFK